MAVSPAAVDRQLGHLLSHSGFLGAHSFFISWFKTGHEPAVETEQLFYAYRLHARHRAGRPVPLEEAAAKPRGAHRLRDGVFFMTLLTSRSAHREDRRFHQTRRSTGWIAFVFDGRAEWKGVTRGFEGRPYHRAKRRRVPHRRQRNLGNFNTLTGVVPIPPWPG